MAGPPIFEGYLVREKPLEKADTIVVMAGEREQRLPAAARLYHEGRAPRIRERFFQSINCFRILKSFCTKRFSFLVTIHHLIKVDNLSAPVKIQSPGALQTGRKLFERRSHA